MMALIKKMFNYFIKYFSPESKKLRRIKEITRFQNNTTDIFGNSFVFVDSLSFLWQYEDIFKENIYKFITENENPFIIDCGANIGLSILYFKKLYPGCRILAFEADPLIYEVCKENINNFGFINVEIINEALSSDEGYISFYSEGADGGRIVHEGFSDRIKKISSKVLSKFINEDIDLLKIDIEGSEYDVLSEVKNKLHFVKNIFIEYHSFTKTEQNLHKILEILNQEGFRYYLKTTGIINKSPLVKREEYAGIDNFINIFCYKA